MNDQQLDEFFRKRIREKEETFPDSIGDQDKLWQMIRKKKTQRRRWRYVSGIAASICLVLVSLMLWRTTNQSTEFDEDEISDLAAISIYTEREAMDYIHLQCKKGNPSCESPEFVELESEIEMSFTEMREVERQIALFGEDPVLLKARARIEDQRGKIIREIILML